MSDWNRGGIFGQLGGEHGEPDFVDELLDEIDDGRNRAEAVEAIEEARDTRRHRERMLLIDRLIDEWPETREMLAARLRMRVLTTLDPDGLRHRSAVSPVASMPMPGVFDLNPDSAKGIREAVKARVTNAAVDLAAEVMRRAYERQIARNETLRRLGHGQSMLEWSWKRAEDLVNRLTGSHADGEADRIWKEAEKGR